LLSSTSASDNWAASSTLMGRVTKAGMT
jgi:hypothetical protein